jgi:hypothetical protein
MHTKPARLDETDASARCEFLRRRHGPSVKPRMGFSGWCGCLELGTAAADSSALYI